MKVTQPREKIGKEVEARIDRLNKMIYSYEIGVGVDEHEARRLIERRTELENLYAWMTRQW